MAGLFSGLMSSYQALDPAVDGANWQRRSLTNPPVVPVREQMGRAPFEP